MALEPYWSDDAVTLHLGDCRKVLARLADASIDAIVTDPPYNLSDSRKRDTKCLRRIIAEFALPHDHERNAEVGEGLNFARPAVGTSDLGGIDGPIGVDAGVGVPERAVDLQGAAVVEQEIDGRDVAATETTNRCLPLVDQPKTVQSSGGYVLQLADAGDASFCDGTCSCFTEPSAGLIAVTVALSSSTARDLAGSNLGPKGWSNKDVRPGDDARCEPEASSLVVAGPGAVVHAVLSLDLLRRTGDLRITDRACDGAPVLKLAAAQRVGALSRTGGLAAELEPARISLVDDGADRAFSLYFPWHEVNPSGRTGGFMGKEWDGWDSPAAYQRWCLAWARECLRVLKPGGHLLAFGGTRTWHRLAVAIEDAGFEIRDTIHWIYGSGFPKGQDIGKAIDRRRDDRPGILRVTAYLAAARAAAGLSHRQIDAAFGFNGMASHWTAVAGKAACVPTMDQWECLRELLGFGDEMDQTVTELNGRKGDPGEAWGQREVVGERHSGLANGATSVFLNGTTDYPGGMVPITAPASDDARRWEGWNTSLKPAHEPIVLARKSTGFNTAVANVLEHGTGALNIDACRVEGPADNARADKGGYLGYMGGDRPDKPYTGEQGRWPTNLIFAHSQGCVEGGPCEPDCPVVELNRQSGVTSSSGGSRGGQIGVNATFGTYEHSGPRANAGGLGDRGGASRFFPTFRYEAKAPSSERPKLADGTAHSTVKPLTLMRFLTRLITPPGGVVLDPFAGSGTTGEACVIEGFQAVLIELEPAHAELIKTRLSKAIQPDLFGGGR